MHLRNNSYILVSNLIMTDQYKPTDAELEILKVLWEYGSNSVRFVHEKLNDTKSSGYTTTLKFMQIMTEKGLVIRNTDQRSHIYTANVKESDIQLQMVDKLVNTAFKGSAMKLVMQALGNHKTSEAELKEIKDLIKKIEKDAE